MLRILYWWGELLCDAWKWLWWGEKFPITVFCLQQGLNWIYAQCWNLRLQIPPKGFSTHLCHSRIISSHNTCFSAILCLKHKYKAFFFTRHFAVACSIVWDLWEDFVWDIIKFWQFSLSCLEDICVCLLDNKREELRHFYHLWAEGLISNAAGRRRIRRTEREKKCVKEREWDIFTGKQVDIRFTPQSFNKMCSVSPFSLLYYEYWLWPRVMTR